MALPTEEELRAARGKAVDAKLVADGKQREYEASRKQADALMTHYYRLLEQFQGQLAFDEESS